MPYDERVPHVLKKEQQWFGSIIGRPIDEDSRMNPISPSGQSMEEEASEHILPSPTLRPAQRIQIYNQQYWWRLLNTLHESFPFTMRLFGYFDFNRIIGIPYLMKCPPRHWSLALLGDRLSTWCLEDYHSPDSKLISLAAELDWAYSESFTEQALPPLTAGMLASPDDMADIFEKAVYLQPYIHLFEYDYDLFSYRVEFLKQDPEYWLHNDFPVLDRSRPFYYVLFRTKTNDISWKEISLGEYLILSRFQKGASINSICEWLEDQEPALYESAAESLQIWFHEWAQREWLSLQERN
ncbi:MAG TPA: putative DNA-binding domain-containing protein [Parachlamydiaceae bacterium]|nr:putative DNA-binding domain-containing protein [Parachlamydiaceae bacterium]